MKFGPTVLLEIVSIVQEGLATGIDISQKLRDIEVQPDPIDPERLNLTPEYAARRSEEL